MADRRDAVVVGGGLAGIAAALRLADSGRQVALVEGRPRLGGAAFSFRRGELTIDNGQHVFLRCCDHYRALLARLGVADRVVLQDRLDIAVLRPGGRTAHLTRAPKLPAPLHLGPALARYGQLAPADRLRAARGALALRRLHPADPALDAQTLGGYLRAHGQNDATIGALWGIIATATLNIDPDEASLALAAKVFRTALLDDALAADVGYAAAPLGELHGTAALAALRAAGVDVHLAHRVEAVRPGEVIARDRGDGGARRAWSADAIVLAVPHKDATAALPALLPRGFDALGATPIVNVHVVYDRPVTDLPFAAAVDSPVQWVFDRTDTSGLARGQYLAVTVSAADAIVDRPTRDVTAQYVAALASLLPAAARAEVREAFVTRERRATFRQAPGSAAVRPAAHSGIPGIWLAGAWTATGWPDTMEGAVRSGLIAADAVLGHGPVSGKTPIFAHAAPDSGMVEG